MAVMGGAAISHPLICKRLPPLDPSRVDLEGGGQPVNYTAYCRANFDLLDNGLIGSGEFGELFLGDAFGFSGLPESGADADLCLFKCVWIIVSSLTQ